jgi:hypothetical protein
MNPFRQPIITDIRALPPAKYFAGETRTLVTTAGQYYNAISNGPMWVATSCAHVGTLATAPAPSTVLPGAPAVFTDYGFGLFINTGTTWSPDELVGGTAVLDFGTTGSQEASVVVTGQGSILATSQVILTVHGDATSSNRTASDHRYFQLFGHVNFGTIVPGVGFTIYGTASDQLTGQYTVTWQWS